MTNDILHKWLDAVEYRIVGGADALWNCWGPNARYIDATSKDGKNEFSICIGGDRQVLAIYVYDITNDLAWRWFAKPEIAKAHADECVLKKCPDTAWDTVKYTDLEELNDILEKTRSKFLGEEYDYSGRSELVKKGECEMTNRFDFEQKIMQCWSVVEDIKSLKEQIQNFPEFMTHDRVAMYLLGLETAYQMKFDQLFNMFERMVKEKKIT